jgi:hypothetical protein
MNIALHFKKEQLNSFIEILQDQEIQMPVKIADKCMYYLYTSALKKMLKKQVDKADCYTKKPFKVSFKYEEATAIYLELIKIKDAYGVYESNLIIAIKTDLHQKLY